MIDRDDLRLDIDQLVLSRRFGRDRLSIGKQTVAWVVLDGIQVTDRFDPVPRRDSVPTEVRPECLARWGLRWRIGGEGLNGDLAVAFDPTVNQLARFGDRFQPMAPRLLGKLDLDSMPGGIVLSQSDRDRYWRDATAGLRLSRRFGRADASLLFLSGPDPEPEPLLQLTGTMNGQPIVWSAVRRFLGNWIDVPACLSA